MIIRNKFNGYGFDGSRLCHDPVSLSIAATQAGAASSAAAAALAAKTAAATTAATTAATAAAGKTAALELAKKEAISAGMKQAGTEAAKQGIAQAGQQAGVEAAKQTGVEAAKQGIFSANPAGMPPTAGAPITPPAGPVTPAGPVNPAGINPTTPAGDFNPAYAEQMGQQNAQRLAAEGFKPAPPGQAQQLTASYGNTGPQTINPVKQPFQHPEYFKNIVDPKGADAVKMAQASSRQVADVGTSYYDKIAVPEGIGFKPPEPNPLLNGVKMGLDLVKKHPMETGLGLMTAGQYMNKPEEEDKDKYKNTVDMSEFQPSIPTQRPFTRSYEYQSYQAGGPVEDMSRMNSLGANTGYPMANLQTPMYSNPSMQRPEATNVIAPSADAGVTSYSGEPRFAEGGLSAAQRREYGLKTRGQRAAQSLTKSYEEMEEERQREAMKLFGESSLPTPRPIARSRTQELSSPFSAALAEHARLGKKTKVPVVQMPKTNLGDIDNYMDIPIEAASGGIMQSREMNFANGGPAFMGPIQANAPQQSPAFMGPTQANAPQQGPAFMGSVGAGSYAEGAAPVPVMFAPQYNAPAQQAFYSPISYQDDSSYQMPAQQSDMSDFYNYMDQQLANYGDYGYAEGGIMHGLGGYSDGGRLLKGPGDGVSDSIPAVIGKRQPARLADGEFVIPARIVSELGNGSTEAGARKLYAMMERVQASRKKSIGKKKVAVNSKSDKHLPA